MSMLDDRSNMVPLLEGSLVHETDKSYLIRFKEKGVVYQKWIPKSKTHINNLKQYCIPQWLYDKLISE
jgi:hypothetical protein